jgi:hypothetical protein
MAIPQVSCIEEVNFKVLQGATLFIASQRAFASGQFRYLGSSQGYRQAEWVEITGVDKISQTLIIHPSTDLGR